MLICRHRSVAGDSPTMARTGVSEARVIVEIVLSGADSRAALCQRLGLSKGAVTQLVNRLLKAGLLAQGDRLNTSPLGRKTTLLTVPSDLAYFIGTDLEGLALRACIIDCHKNVIATGKCALGPSWSRPRIVKQWTSLVAGTVADAHVDPERIAGLGIGLPGIVSQELLCTRTFLPPGGRAANFDAGKALGKLGYQMTAANNVVCVSEYERKLGAAVGAEHFVSVLARYDIGAAIYADGSLVIGQHLATGELGHMRLESTGPRCICGRPGCLDVFASGRTWNPEKLNTTAKLKAELRRRGHYLGIALANLLKLHYVPLVLINGIYNHYETLIKPPLLETLDQELAGMNLPVPKTIFGQVVGLKTSIGAALRGAEVFFEQHLRNGILSRRLTTGTDRKTPKTARKVSKK